MLSTDVTQLTTTMGAGLKELIVEDDRKLLLPNNELPSGDQFRKASLISGLSRWAFREIGLYPHQIGRLERGEHNEQKRETTKLRSDAKKLRKFYESEKGGLLLFLIDGKLGKMRINTIC